MKKKQRDREYAIKSYLKGESITAIARKLGRSRPWVYKWIERYQGHGEADHWQEEQPRCPHSNPRQLPGVVVEAVSWRVCLSTTKVCSAARKRSVGSWKRCKFRRCPVCAPLAE